MRTEDTSKAKQIKLWQPGFFNKLREGFKKKKKVKLGLLAEVRAGGRLRGGWRPNPVIRYFFIALKWFKCFKTRNKAIKYVNVLTPHHPSPKPILSLYQNWYRIWKYDPYFPGYIVGGPQFSNKIFHGLRCIDFNKTIKKIT